MSAQADTNCHDIFNIVSATRTHLAKIGAKWHVVPTCRDMWELRCWTEKYFHVAQPAKITLIPTVARLPKQTGTVRVVWGSITMRNWIDECLHLQHSWLDFVKKPQWLAPAGNRTRGQTMGMFDFTTKPLALVEMWMQKTIEIFCLLLLYSECSHDVLFDVFSAFFKMIEK